MTSFATVETPLPVRRVHIIGAGPVGLLVTALLQSLEGFDVRLYEKRRDYTRTRMVKLAPYLVAESVSAYRADQIDGENVEAVFDPSELEESLAFRQAMSPRVRALLQEWTQGFCALNTIEKALSELIDAQHGPSTVERVHGVLTAEEATALLEPGDLLLDCTGCKSLLRDHLVPGSDAASGEEANTLNLRLEYAAVITFLYGRPYACNEYCKYYKNLENPRYKFIPAVDRTCYDGSISHVTGIVNISAEEYEVMPPRSDGPWLRSNFPGVATSMDRFIDRIKQETQGEIIGDLEIIRIPLNLYRARNATSRRWRGAGSNGHPFSHSPVFLVGDSAIGSPYFQSISLGFECAMFLAGLLAHRDLPTQEILERYELHIYKQWLRVYMRSKLIKHNKDIFERVDDTFALLEKLHIY